MPKVLVLLALASLVETSATEAQPVCAQPIARFETLVNQVRLIQTVTHAVVPAELRMDICPGDTISVDDRSRAVVVLLRSGEAMIIDENSQFTVVEVSDARRSLIDLIRGAIFVITRQPRLLDVRTPFVNAAVEGTEFVVRVTDDRTVITVLEGSVRASNDSGTVLIGSNQVVEAIRGQAPVLQIVVRPRDAVQWALYLRANPSDRFIRTARPDSRSPA